MQEFLDAEIEPMDLDGMELPLLRLNDIDVPATLIRVRTRDFQYDRSYPIKGYGAIMPAYVAEQLAAGRRPLVVERLTRYYLYWEVEPEAPPASAPAAEAAASEPAATAEPAAAEPAAAEPAAAQ